MAALRFAPDRPHDAAALAVHAGGGRIIAMSWLPA